MEKSVRAISGEKVKQNSARNDAKCSKCFQFLCNNTRLNMVFQCIKFRQVTWEVLKTAAFGLSFQHLPRDLANVNAWKTMFDPYIDYLSQHTKKGTLWCSSLWFFKYAFAVPYLGDMLFGWSFFKVSSTSANSNGSGKTALMSRITCLCWSAIW